MAGPGIVELVGTNQCVLTLDENSFLPSLCLPFLDVSVGRSSVRVTGHAFWELRIKSRGRCAVERVIVEVNVHPRSDEKNNTL